MYKNICVYTGIAKTIRTTMWCACCTRQVKPPRWFAYIRASSCPWTLCTSCVRCSLARFSMYGLTVSAISCPGSPATPSTTCLGYSFDMCPWPPHMSQLSGQREVLQADAGQSDVCDSLCLLCIGARQWLKWGRMKARHCTIRVQGKAVKDRHRLGSEYTLHMIITRNREPTHKPRPVGE